MWVLVLRLPPTKALGPRGKRARDRPKDKLLDVEPARKKKPKAENNKVFDRTKVQTALVWPSTSTYTKAVLEHCEKFFVADSEIYEPIAKVIEEVFRADGALAAGDKMSPFETKGIIEEIQRFIRERKLTVGDHVEDEYNSIAETTPDGMTIHLHRDLSSGYAMKEADQTQKRRALALGTLKFVHEMMHSLTPCILDMSFQRKRANGIETKKSDLTKPTKRGKAKKALGVDMGFALEELLSGGRRFFPKSKLSKIGSIQVAERNDKGQWVKRSLKKQSEEELIDTVLAPKIDFGRLGTLCAATVEEKKNAKKRAKKQSKSQKKRAHEDEEDEEDEDEEDEGDEECPVLDEGDEEDEGGDEFPIIEKYNPNRKK